jgi:hypothetical protein
MLVATSLEYSHGGNQFYLFLLNPKVSKSSLMLVATSLAIFSWWQSVLSLPAEPQGRQELTCVGCHIPGNILMVAISFISSC